MKNCLVLFTKTYPFDKGEEFIEDEVPVLAKAFDRVILIATSTSDLPEQTRSVPNNVSVRHISASTIKHLIPLTSMRFFPFTGCRGYVDSAERTLIKGSIQKRAYLAYFLAKSDAVYDEASKILADYDLQSFDGVTYYSYWLYDIALAAIRFKKYSPAGVKRVVSRAHRYDLYAYLNVMDYLPLRGYLLDHLDMIYPCSGNGTSYLDNLCPGHREKIKTAYLGTHDYGLSPVAETDVIHLVSCCHISPVKRVHLLAEALAQLKSSGLKLKWTHFGDGETLESLKKYAQDNLSFMETEFAGNIRNEDLMTYYQSHAVDWFVNTSSSEGLPVSIMEACSFGIPSVATNVGGTSEIVRDKETGFLLGQELTPKALAEKLYLAATLPKPHQQEFRTQCRSLWENTFCAESNFTRFAEEIQPIPQDNN